MPNKDIEMSAGNAYSRSRLASNPRMVAKIW